MYARTIHEVLCFMKCSSTGSNSTKGWVEPSQPPPRKSHTPWSLVSTSRVAWQLIRV